MNRKRWWGYRLLGLGALGFFGAFVYGEVDLWRHDWRVMLVLHGALLLVASAAVGLGLLMRADEETGGADAKRRTSRRWRSRN